MLKNLIQFLHIEAEKEVKLLCEPDTTLPILKNALIKFMTYVQQVEDANIKAQADAKAKADSEAASKISEESKVVS